MQAQGAERRRSGRESGYGMVLLVPRHGSPERISGVLIDTNDSGFRVRHRYSAFKENDLVSFPSPSPGNSTGYLESESGNGHGNWFFIR
ncbi:MAG: hypothetical protein DMG58_01985 [Acidobacteria bacterium]|nr:MAG: hypothetical protein DMG58_01985 [Acidobacteriota bacterium]